MQAQLNAAHNDSEKVLALTKEVKEKNLLIGKLRHEGVSISHCAKNTELTARPTFSRDLERALDGGAAAIEEGLEREQRRPVSPLLPTVSSAFH